MARWRYAGPGPQEDGAGGIVRPGDVREFDAGPAWGPWEELGDGDPAAPPEAPVSLPQPPPPPAPTPGTAKPAQAATAAPEPPLGATGTEGM